MEIRKKRLKNFFITSFFLIILILLFAPVKIPDNSNFKNNLDSVSKEDVIIVFNSGGWGDTPPEKADDFKSIIKGIQDSLTEIGYDSIVVPYKRTENSFLGRIEGVREIFRSFENQSGRLVRDIELFKKDNSDAKMIIAGLSNGGAFVDKVMEKLLEKNISNVFAIEVGVPFWEEPLNSDNVLLLNNKDKDPLSERKIETLLASLLKTPFRWIFAKISGSNLSISRAFYVPNHEYFWDSNNTSFKVKSFLADKFSISNLRIK